MTTQSFTDRRRLFHPYHEAAFARYDKGNEFSAIAHKRRLLRQLQSISIFNLQVLTRPIFHIPFYDVPTSDNLQVEQQLIDGLRLLEGHVRVTFSRDLPFLRDDTPVENVDGFNEDDSQQNGDDDRPIQVDVYLDSFLLIQNTSNISLR